MKIEKINDYVWEIPPTEKEGMQVPARLYVTEKLLQELDRGVMEQATNVACLPGIQKYAFCMPDGHWGYGFPIGGVAAFSLDSGVISPGGIGFDINCGMRLIRTCLTLDEVQPRLPVLMDELYRSIPSGVGGKGFVKLSKKDFDEVMVHGARWCVENGLGRPEDPEHIEEGGRIQGADPARVSDRARERGIHQLGTLGSGNHYLEVQVVRSSNVYHPQAARQMGIHGENQIVVMVHCGSRGFGHQVATDYLHVFDRAMKQYGITVKDRQLACAPVRSPEGKNYYAAMACAANMAFANRQVITHRIRECFGRVFDRSPEALGLEIVYDVAHNIAKRERYTVDGVEKELLVHRKGATRSFGPSDQIPEDYRGLGQPVIVGGSMETGSYLLLGTSRAQDETFGSTLHGSGRTMSRKAAQKRIKGKQLLRQMEEKGIVIRTASLSGLAEEAGFAYKNISEVVETVDQAGISRKVAQLIPIGNIKG